MTRMTPHLSKIIKDPAKSHYINDDYYALLRHDLTEWKASGEALTEKERAIYETLILREGWLLDQREFEQWYNLFSAQCVYWAPANAGMPDPVSGDPQNQMALFFDDRRRMADRVVWLRTEVAASQTPPSRTQHVISGCVRVLTDRKGEVKIRSQFVLSELRDRHAVCLLTGWTGHVFIEEEGATRIDRKLICMLDADMPRTNPSFII